MAIFYFIQPYIIIIIILLVILRFFSSRICFLIMNACTKAYWLLLSNEGVWWGGDRKSFVCLKYSLSVWVG